MRRVVLAALLPSALALAGCGGTAVLVAETARGGVLSLDGEHAQAMADARRQISELCGGAYTIVGEHRAFTGVYRGQIFTEDLVEFACRPNP